MTRRTALCLPLLLVACGGSSPPTTTPSGGASAPPAATFTSIASAAALDGTLRFALGCPGTAYVGPFAFAKEGEAVTLTSRVLSPSGQQVCASGAFVDSNDVQVASAGPGCAEGTRDVAATLTHAYMPGAGGPNASPVFLKLWIGEGAAAPCPELWVTLEPQTLPGR